MTKTIAKQTTLIVVIIVINAFSIKSETLSGLDLDVDNKVRSTVITSSIFLNQYALLPDDSMNHDGHSRPCVWVKTIPLATVQRRHGQVAWKDFSWTSIIKVNSIIS